ncbi:galactokinase-like [Daktulosphaira vitifoliae]|uniref:galactokinase-like n=1 Tax=Daktulosphaira vitifoliae TaxID=58002 RepID=UPI0021AAB577|nr:galactokinase-like [Daktulosphaira vitifoliae]XP_050542960.1 galactokinase-like [Daktulosphaira vitifoliae]
MSVTQTDTMEELIKKGFEFFDKHFPGGKKPDKMGVGPGRVNLIGEHTDYNEGYVLPMALPMVTIMLGRTNDTDTCRVVTASSDIDCAKESNYAEFKIPSIKPLSVGVPKWANYVKGVIACFQSIVVGFDAVILSSVPLGGGLSSSASLEVATYSFIEAITGNKTTQLVKKVMVCQNAEHMFAGVPCGIMDQFISVMGVDGHALLIDCKTLQHELVPFTDTNYLFLITNSNIHHELSDGQYQLRRFQCEEASDLLNVTSLRSATLDNLNRARDEGKINLVIYKRAKHVITEIERTKTAANVLSQGDYKKFGELMNESHNSLRDDFEVSCRELDQLVELARKVPGVLGSRMTGGGFGGCTITLVERNIVDLVVDIINSEYKQDPKFYVVSPSCGAKIFTSL